MSTNQVRLEVGSEVVEVEGVDETNPSVMEYLDVVVADMTTQLQAMRSRLKISTEKVARTGLTPCIYSQCRACELGLDAVEVLIAGLLETAREDMTIFGT